MDELDACLEIKTPQSSTNNATANHVEPEGSVMTRLQQGRFFFFKFCVRHAIPGVCVDAQTHMCAFQAYSRVETGQHLLQSAPLILEIRLETINKERNVLQVAIGLHLSFGGLAESAFITRIATGLQHLHTAIESQA